MRMIDPISLKQALAVSAILEDKKTIEQIIDEQPTIELRCEECEAFNKTRLLVPQPERKKGTWEQVKGTDGYYDFRCSACHRFRFHNGEFLRKYKWCPNCGADMRGSQE